MPKNPWLTKRRKKRKPKAKVSEVEASAVEESRKIDHVVPAINPASEMSDFKEIKNEPIFPRTRFSHSTTLFPSQGIEGEQETPMERASTSEVATPSCVNGTENSIHVPGTTSQVSSKDVPPEKNQIRQVSIKTEPSNDSLLQASASAPRPEDLKRKSDEQHTDRLASLKRKRTDSTSSLANVSTVLDENPKVKEEPVNQTKVTTEIETAPHANEKVGESLERAMKQEPTDIVESPSSGTTIKTSPIAAGNKAPEIADEITIIEKPLGRNVKVEIIDLTDDPPPCVETVSPPIEINKGLEKESSSSVSLNTANPSGSAVPVKSETIASSEVLALGNSFETVVNENLSGTMATNNLFNTSILKDSSNTVAVANDRTQAVSVNIKSEKPSNVAVNFDNEKMDVDGPAAQNSVEKSHLGEVAESTTKHIHSPPDRLNSINNTDKETSVDSASTSSDTIRLKTEPEDTPCESVDESSSNAFLNGNSSSAFVNENSSSALVSENSSSAFVNENSSSAFVNENSFTMSVKLENEKISTENSVRSSSENFPGLRNIFLESSTVSENNFASSSTFQSAHSVQSCAENSQNITEDGIEDALQMSDEITRGSLAEVASADIVDDEFEDGLDGPPYNHAVEFPTPLLKYLHINVELDVFEISNVLTCLNSLAMVPSRRNDSAVGPRVITDLTSPVKSKIPVVGDQEEKALSHKRIQELSVKEIAEKVSSVFGINPRRTPSLHNEDSSSDLGSSPQLQSHSPPKNAEELVEKVSVRDMNPRKTPSLHNEDSSPDLGSSPLFQSHSHPKNAVVDQTKYSLDPDVLKNLMNIDISKITSVGKKESITQPTVSKNSELNQVAYLNSVSDIDYSNVPMDIECSSAESSQEDNTSKLSFVPTCEPSSVGSCKEGMRVSRPSTTRDLRPIISSPLSTHELRDVRPIISSPLSTHELRDVRPIISSPLSTHELRDLRPIISSPLSTHELRQIIRVTENSSDDRLLCEDSHPGERLASSIKSNNSIDLRQLDHPDIKRALQNVSRSTVQDDSFETPPRRGREGTNDGVSSSKNSKVKLDLREYRMKRLQNPRDPRTKVNSLSSESGQMPLSSQYNSSNLFTQSLGISSDGRLSQSMFAPLNEATGYLNQSPSPTINQTFVDTSPATLVSYPQSQNPRLSQADFADYLSQNFISASAAVSEGQSFLQSHHGSVAARDVHSLHNIPATSYRSSLFRTSDLNSSSSARLPCSPQNTNSGGQGPTSHPESSTQKQHSQIPNSFKASHTLVGRSNPIQSQSTNFMSFSGQADNTGFSISPVTSRREDLFNPPLPADSPPLPPLPPPIADNAEVFMRIQSASNKSIAVPFHRTASKITPRRISKDLPYGASRLKLGGESDYIRLLPASLKADISNNIIHTNDVYLIIIDWGVEFILKNTTTPPPISPNFYHVRNTYNTPLEYYNTYFPLLLLECWHKISQALRAKEKCREKKYDFECTITQFEQKQSYISVTCDTVINSSDLETIPKDGHIILVKFATIDPSKGLKMLGYVCSSASRAFSMRHDQRHPTMKNFEGKDPRFLTKIKISFYITNSSDNIIKDSFSWITKISSIKKALMQNDALKELSRSPLCDVIVNPVQHKVSAVSLPQRQDKTNMAGVIQGIVQSVMNPSKPQLIVVKTSPSTDSVLAVVQIVQQIQKSEAPGKVLVCVRHDVLSTMAAILISECSDVVIINREREKVHERHQKRGLDKMVDEIIEIEQQERDSAKCIVLQQSRVLLAVTTNCFYEDVRFMARDIQFCIVHDAHSFTEPESVLPLLYGVRFLVLLGDPGESCTVNSKAAVGYDYNKSLFQRAYSVS